MNLFFKKPIIIDNLRAWINLNAKDISWVEELDNSKEELPEMPLTLKGDNLEFNMVLKPQLKYPRYIAEIKNVKLINRHGPLLPLNKFIPIETVWIEENVDVSKRLFLKSLFKSESTKDVPYFSCLFFWGKPMDPLNTSFDRSGSNINWN